MSLTNVTGSFYDSTGQPITRCSVTFQPVTTSGNKLSYRSADGAAVTADPISTQIGNIIGAGAGTFSLSLEDVNTVEPGPIAYALSLIDNATGQNRLSSGYGLLQPTGASWSLNQHTPSGQLGVTVIAGPVGKTGSVGIPGTPGSAGKNGQDGQPGPPGLFTGGDAVSGGFSIAGMLSAAQAQVTKFITYLTTDNPNSNTHQFVNDIESAGPGVNIANLGGAGWSVLSGLQQTVVAYTRGITQCLFGYLGKRSIGDNCGLYMYCHPDGGFAAQSDEGSSAITAHLEEQTGHYHGVVAATTGTGDLQPLLTTNGNYPSWVTDGATLINLKTAISGQLTGPPVRFGATNVSSLPTTDVVLPQCTAWGTVPAYIPTAYQPMNVNTPQNIVVTPGQIDGVVQPFTPGLIVVAGNNYPEKARCTAVGGIAPDGTQTITLATRVPNDGATLFQGGCTGQYLSFRANYNLNDSKRRTTYWVYGSVDGVNLLHGSYLGGSLRTQTVPSPGYEAAQFTGINSAFDIYQGAEIVLGPRPDNSGTLQPTVEPNDVNWAVGDPVECPHYPRQNTNALWLIVDQDSVVDPSAGGYGINLTATGNGVTSAYHMLTLGSGNPWTSYVQGGGPLVAPLLTNIFGCYSQGLRFDQAPYGGALLSVNGLPAFDAANDSIQIWNLPGSICTVTPSTGTTTISNLEVYGLEVTSHLQVDRDIDVSGGSATGPLVIHDNYLDGSPASINLTGNIFTGGLQATDGIACNGNYYAGPNGKAGLNGNYTIAVGTVIEVTGGIITNITAP